MNNNQNYQHPQQQFQNNPNMGYQQPPKKKMSTGCIVGIVIGVIMLIVALIIGAVLIMGIIAAGKAIEVVGSDNGDFISRSIQSEIDSYDIEIYNMAFDMYTGQDKVARSVSNIMAVAKATNEDEDEPNKVEVNISLKDGTTMTYDSYDSTRINQDSHYSIIADKNEKGYIYLITIKER